MRLNRSAEQGQRRAQRIRASRPSWAGKQQMVEAGGQLTRSFHCGLDYAFILAGHPASMRSVLSGRSLCSCLILVLALNPGHSRRVYESLQGRPEVGPLPTPRRCHAAVIVTAPSGFTDVSSVFIRPLRADATIDRTPVRKPYASASTYVAVSLILTRRYPSSREDATPADGDS